MALTVLVSLLSTAVFDDSKPLQTAEARQIAYQQDALALGAQSGAVDSPERRRALSEAALGTWIEDASVGATKIWTSVAMSADGTKQTAAVRQGNLWVSTDSGATWTEDASVGATKEWSSVAMSADGTKQTAAVYSFDGNLWMSTDSGATWTEDTSTSAGAYKFWNSVAMSADGTKQTAADGGEVNSGNLWTSTDSGTTWTEDSSVGATKSWGVVAMSADGTKQTAAVGGFNGGNLWTSTDSGATWTEDASVGAIKYWNAVAMSADGTKQTAAVGGYQSSGGNLWTSTDSGATWTEDTSFGAMKSWNAVAMSADGTKQTAAIGGTVGTGNLWTSTDSGATWTEDTSVGTIKNWKSVAMSADGAQQTAAAGYTGNLWINNIPPSPPPPLAAPPPPPSSAGDDPTFIGSDGAAYHVQGTPWKYFNVISAPTISLNAQFLPVKPGFAHGKITDTVLGLLHLAICDAATGRTLGVLFDVFSGERHCTLRQPGEPEFGGSQPVDCATALASFGVSITEEGAACLLQSAQCGHVPVSKLQATLRDEPSAVQLNMARFNVSVGGARLSLLRDLVDRPELPIDCGPLARWARAHKACEIIARSLSGQEADQELSTLAPSDRVAVMAYLTAGNRSRQMHFHNILVEALPFNQSDVHGLLGQRSVGPVSPIAKTNTLAAQDGFFTSTEQLSVDAAGTTIRATVAADGTMPQLQGEGAIEGVYTSYQVKHISLHGAGAFAHTRFNCPAPPVESRD